MTFKNDKGETMYPVCSWEKNQHKLYNAHDRAMVALYENGYNNEIEAELERIEKALNAFECGLRRDGIVYATYRDGLLIKSFIYGYNARH